MKDPATAETFIELYEKIEKMCKTVILSLVKITAPLFIFPAILASISNYFLLNMGEESFEWNFPALYVFRTKLVQPTLFPKSLSEENFNCLSLVICFWKIAVQYKEMAWLSCCLCSRSNWSIRNVCWLCTLPVLFSRIQLDIDSDGQRFYKWFAKVEYRKIIKKNKVGNSMAILWHR